MVSGFAPGASVTVADAGGTVLGAETAAGGSVVVRLSRAVVSEVLLCHRRVVLPPAHPCSHCMQSRPSATAYPACLGSLTAPGKRVRVNVNYRGSHKSNAALLTT